MRAFLATTVLALVMAVPATARDHEAWEASPAEVRKWYRELKQPDNPLHSCCGEADAYWADSFEVEGDHYVAIITDERTDLPFYRPHIAPGTRVEVPNSKMKFDRGNPTGHGVIFIGTNGELYCYVPPGGV